MIANISYDVTVYKSNAHRVQNLSVEQEVVSRYVRFYCQIRLSRVIVTVTAKPRFTSIVRYGDVILRTAKPSSRLNRAVCS